MRWAFDARAGAFVLAVACGASEARAQEEDPSHGRVEGDLSAVAGVGAAVAPRGLRGAADLRLRYLETAGVFATYEEGGLLGGSAQPERLLAAGFELRPLFLFRWLKGYETSDARFDLLIDSLGVELGAVFAQRPGDSFGSTTGVQASLGVEVPILARPAGPWVGVHGGMRWSDEALASSVVRDAADRSAFLAVTLAWHQPVASHIVDLGDEAPR